MTYRAIKCACGHPLCKDWHVSDVADIQGVKFTQAQAELIVRVLNNECGALDAQRGTGRELEKLLQENDGGAAVDRPYVLVVMPRNLGPGALHPRGYASLWAKADVVVEWFDGKFHIMKSKMEKAK